MASCAHSLFWKDWRSVVFQLFQYTAFPKPRAWDNERVSFKEYGDANSSEDMWKYESFQLH